MSGKLLLIYIWNFHVLSLLLLIYICKLHWNLSPLVSKASAGALEFIDVCSTKNLMRFLDKSKENGWQVVGTALEEGSIDMRLLDLTKPTILVLGNEGHGIRTNILKRCDALVKIRGMENKSSNGVDSLNVSVSGGILLHHILNR